MPEETQNSNTTTAVLLPIDIFTSSAVATTVLREDGLVRFVNAAARELYEPVGGMTWRVGETIKDLPGSSYMASRIVFMRELAAAEQNGVSRDLIGGRQVFAYLHLLPVVTPGELRQFFIIHHRSTEFTAPVVSRGVAFHDPKQQHLGELDLLTPRELEVLSLVTQGMTAPEIAKHLHRSLDTIHTHRGTILRKLDCYNAVQLARLAIEAGLKFEDASRFHG
ncbi:MAG: LuxR C-terminal-related transcriptional regulator [Planctomycetota bacterium]|nr:LuxR C-terminal-related transcriptional regulator [Planctomycetota bacterium]